MLWLTILPAPSPTAIRLWPELACRLGRYTPRVSLAASATNGDNIVVRLEITASLRLFGGLTRLIESVQADLAEILPEARLAVAATPLAALWLARSHSGTICPDPAATHAALIGVPLAALELKPDVALRLAGFGLRRLGEVLALPRSALGARLGKGFVLDLARALGEVDDPQPWFEFPDRFEQALELPASVDAAPVLLFAARRLIAALSGWLAARNAAVHEICWLIDHGRGQQTALPLRFSSAVHAAPRIERVLKEALERCALVAPALGLRLVAEHSEVRDARSAVLFEGAAAGGEALAELMDRLSARLGAEAVQGLARYPDYRPELASRSVTGKVVRSGTSGGTASNTPDQPPRPLWLIDPPEALREHAGRPQRGGPLRLLGGPERIESGWWDGEDARRDYFVAMDGKARWLWIFRDPRPSGGWFLHGLFS